MIFVGTAYGLGRRTYVFDRRAYGVGRRAYNFGRHFYIGNSSSYDMQYYTQYCHFEEEEMLNHPNTKPTLNYA